MVWICVEEGKWIYWPKDVKDGAARWEGKRKIHGCGRVGWLRWQVEADDPLRGLKHSTSCP